MTLKVWCLMNAFFLAAPTTVIATAESGTSLRVTFVVPTEADPETVLRASIGDNFCEVVAKSSPLACILNGLQRGEKYTVGALGCQGETKCSHLVYAEGYTQPDGKFD